MTFNYSNLSRNQMHHNMVSLLGSMANGNSFLPPLAASTSSISPLTGPQSLATSSLSTAALNDNPLEFKTPASSLPSRERHSNQQAGQMGAAPMDLENENDNTSPLEIATANLRKFMAGQNSRTEVPQNTTVEGDSSNANTHTVENTSAANALLMTNEMYLNGLMGAAQTQHLAAQAYMMMPGMMMDPTSLALQMQQYPLMQAAALSQTAADSMVPTNTQNENAHQSAASVQMKEVVKCKSCTLFPPNPTAPPPTIRERPQGCRTVFVGGLPENITDEIIREIFESCGEISTLRLSKKNFCHIRFVYESSVDSAIYLSGYRIRVGNSSEPANCGRLHVDFAQARDDQYEWECKQRQLQREQRHRERMERDRQRSASPPPIVHYTEHEATLVAEKLKNDETFYKTIQTLITWLERGDCSKRNANIFYSMIQSTNSHVRRLTNDKTQFEDELKRARQQFRKQMLSMSQQFAQIEKVFNAASHKKVWDHFTKAQRKNIDHWKRMSTELRSVQIEDDEMEMSDEDRDCRSSSGSSKRARYDNENLKEENDSLRCQLEAYKNEMNLVRSDIKCDSDVREKQIKVLQETIRNLQSQLIANKNKEKDFTSKISDLEEKLKEANVKQLLLKTKIVEVNSKNNNSSSKNSDADDIIEKYSTADVPVAGDEEAKSKDSEQSESTQVSPSLNNSQNNTQPKTLKIDLDEAKIIGLVSTFLVVHPLGASPDYICSYLQKIVQDFALRTHQLEDILCKYRTIFSEETTGVGAKIERKWKFCGFDAVVDHHEK